MKELALQYLRTSLDNPHALFRDGQWESIEQLLNQKRVLVVQRTGWGKSMVYFLVTKLLRDQGAGPTLLISPLLSLMRNQLEAAQRIEVSARSINSTNTDEWQQIHDELFSNQVDVLLISPERLANDEFRQNVLAQGKYQTNHFLDNLVAACVEMLQDWTPDPAPKWLTCIPSLDHPELVPDFAERLANALDLPFLACIENTRANRQQKDMENSYQQVKNLDGVFHVTDQCMAGECLLVDDMVDSGWTFTVASALLRQAGCTAVYPMALALNSPRKD